jgi:hypothetical protein
MKINLTLGFNRHNFVCQITLSWWSLVLFEDESVHEKGGNHDTTDIIFYFILHRELEYL